MARPNRFRYWVAAAWLLAALASACTTPEPAADAAEWGASAELYFDHLAQAYTDNDFYGVLDFYAPAAEVNKWRADNRGGSSVPELLRWNSADLGQEVQTLYIGEGTALALLHWPSSGDYGAVVAKIEAGLIAGETVFDLSGPLGRSLRASPDVISTYDELAVAYASAWSGTDHEAVSRLYADAATLRDPLVAVEAVGRPSILGIPRSGRWTLLQAPKTTQSTTGDQPPAVYLGPAQYGTDPARAVGIFSVVDVGGCERRIAVRWQLEHGVIVDEQRYHEIESVRRCSVPPLPQGWWSNLDLPGASDEIVTGVIATPEGEEIAVHNGTPLLEGLLGWGMGRFAAAGLDVPQLDRVIFAPSRKCETRSGRLIDDGTTRNLYLCMYETEVCEDANSCEMIATGARVAVLHELGHAWMLDHVSDATESRLLRHSGRETWNDLAVPWVDRGVEYAADVMAWGLIDADIPTVRLGSLPCSELAGAFALLTNVDPVSAVATMCPTGEP